MKTTLNSPSTIHSAFLTNRQSLQSNRRSNKFSNITSDDSQNQKGIPINSDRSLGIVIHNIETKNINNDQFVVKKLNETFNNTRDSIIV